MEKSDLMRVLMEKLLRKELQPKKPSLKPEKILEEKSETTDHIFESNQSFQIVKKKIVKRRD